MNIVTLNAKSQDKQESTAREISRSDISYHELLGLRHETKDVLKQLENNILMLEDVGGRLSFVLSEVRSLIRR